MASIKMADMGRCVAEVECAPNNPVQIPLDAGLFVIIFLLFLCSLVSLKSGALTGTILLIFLKICNSPTTEKRSKCGVVGKTRHQVPFHCVPLTGAGRSQRTGHSNQLPQAVGLQMPEGV